MSHTPPNVEHLNSNDVVLMFVLGTVRDKRAPLYDIISTAKEMAPQDWQPTTDIVGGCVVSAMNTRLLQLACRGGPDPAPQLEITESGRGVLRRLLKRPVPCHRGGFGRTCVAAKLCFLECLDPEEQSVQIEELARGYREHLEALRNRLNGCSTHRSPLRRWLVHEIERLEWELAWLDRLRSDTEGAPESDPARARVHGRSP